MKKIFFILLMLSSFSGFSQPTVESGTWVIWNNQAFLKNGSDSTLYGNPELIPYLQNVISLVSSKQPSNGNGSQLMGLTKSQVGLSNADNTADLDKPVSNAMQAALSLKANLITTGTTAQYFLGDLSLATFPTSTAPFANSTDKNFLTDAKLTVINNTTGTNSGDNSANTTYANDYRLANFIAGTNYLAPNGSAAALTSFPTLNQNTTGTAGGLSANIAQSQVTNLVTDLSGKQNAISLTNTGTSGAATLIGNTLNIPNYATGGGGGMTRVFLPSDQINNNAVANTIQDVTGLEFPVVANTTYQFRFVIIYSATATTTGSRWSINGPATTHMSYSSQYPTSATAITNNASLAGYNLPAASNASSAVTTNNRCIIEGEIRPSANGTVIARFASEVLSSAITAVASGRSYVEYQIIN